MTAECYRVLTQVFCHSDYKGKQKEIVEAAMQGRDVFVLAPTGMGKSLCFQIPAVAAKNGVTVVVSPLLALMNNQVSSLRQKLVSVVSFASDTPTAKRQEITDDLSSGHPSCRLLYITPERLCSFEFLKLLDGIYGKGQLNRLVVDEAHCISEWGHDFRADYRKLGVFRNRFQGVPIMALTATATPTVQLDIIRSLKMSQDNIYFAFHPFNRNNLFYEVRYLRTPEQVSQMADIYDFITTLYRRRGRASSGIIYCRRRITCDELSGYLRSKGINSKPYHRGIKSPTLDKTLREWTIGGSEEGGIDVVVATVAFGLGIDKGDVRYIIHYDLPRSFEGYYQETGRAGRDGAPSKCVLYYSRQDAMEVNSWVKGSHNTRCDTDGPPPSQRAIDSLSALFRFAESADFCRHVAICSYFGEIIDSDDPETVRRFCDRMCDVCKYPEKTKNRISKLTPRDGISVLAPAPQQQKVPSRLDGGWKRNFREGDDDENKNIFPSPMLNPPPSRSKSSLGNGLVSYGACKRPGTDNGSAINKKAKVACAPALVTKPHSSTSSLSKPFKPPSRTPFKVPLQVQQPSLPLPSPPHPSSLADETMILNDEEVTIIEEHNSSPELVNTQSSLIPDIIIQLDASFSEKVPSDSRQSACNMIRRALYCVFMGEVGKAWIWENLGRSSGSLKDETITLAASEAEFSALSMCSTQQGYKTRIGETVDIIRKVLPELLRDGSKHDSGEEAFEDAQEILDSVNRAYKNLCTNGKRRAE